MAYVAEMVPGEGAAYREVTRNIEGAHAIWAPEIDPDELEKFEKRVNETPPGPARKVAEQIVEALKKKMGH